MTLPNIRTTLLCAGVVVTTALGTGCQASSTSEEAAAASSCADASNAQGTCVSASEDSGVGAPDGGITLSVGGGARTAEAGSPVPDAGLPVADAGAPVADAGSPASDAGLSVPDAGSPVPDAGLPVLDAGAPVVDVGSPVPDAAPEADTGLAAPDAGPAPPDAGSLPPREISLQFKAEVSGADFACGQSYPNQGSGSTTVTPTDFRFFVQSIRLLKADGSEVPLQMTDRAPWQTPEVALVDFENGAGACQNGNAATNTVITGTVPGGDYTGLAFVNGIPDALNHGDPASAPAPLQQAPGTLWSWLSGYKFVLTELGQVGPDGTLLGGLGLTHIGSSGCSGSPQTGGAVTCLKPNRNEVRLTGFNPDNSVIVADLGVVFAQTDLTVDAQCHSSGAFCPSTFEAMGVNFATGQALTTQRLYHVE
ncbi:MAG: hypothetical protein RLZZ450_6784 [Pseudomonadota bacterium]